MTIKRKAPIQRTETGEAVKVVWHNKKQKSREKLKGVSPKILG